jgi:hypothetical protein
MRKHFLAIHPLIGTANKPSALHLQQRSPYYWWWAYLKRNDEYIACCARGGRGKLAKLYKDFGDVRSDDFRAWWGGSLQRGQHLYAEKPSELKLKRITKRNEWLDDWDGNADVAVFAVNMTIGKRKLQQMFAAALAQHHKGKRGRPALGNVKSTALYPLHRNYSQHNLRTMLETYDAWFTNQALPKSQRKTLWEIGDSLKLVTSAISKSNDTKEDKITKHNVMSVAVNRYVTNAKAIIANTSNGEFPNNKSSILRKVTIKKKVINNDPSVFTHEIKK